MKDKERKIPKLCERFNVILDNFEYNWLKEDY